VVLCAADRIAYTIGKPQCGSELWSQQKGTMKNYESKNGTSVRAHRGDAMTLLAFDLAEEKTENFTGFSVRITPGARPPYYMTNLLSYPAAVLTKNNIKATDKWSTLYSPIQKFRWVHVPATFHQIQKPFYGTYTYEVTPRYMVNDILQPLNAALNPIAIPPMLIGAMARPPKANSTPIAESPAATHALTGVRRATELPNRKWTSGSPRNSSRLRYSHAGFTGLVAPNAPRSWRNFWNIRFAQMPIRIAAQT
jgi:hypothetical protein